MNNTLYYASAMMAERIISFFLLPILTNIVTPAEYALWSQSVMIAGLMTPVVLLGFQTAIVKFFPYWDKNKTKQNSIILFILIVVLLLISAVSVAAIYYDTKLAELLFGDQKLFYYIPLIVGLLVSEAFFELLVAILRVTGRIRRISIYLLMKGVWRISVLTLMLSVIESDYYSAFLAFVLFQFLIIILIYMREINLLSLVQAGIRPGRSHWREVFKFSLPLVPFSILLSINTFSDRLFIVYYHSLELLASYSAAFSIAAIIAFFYSVLSFTLFPELSKRWANGDKHSVAILMNKTMMVYMGLLIPFLVFIMVSGVDTLEALTTKDYIISTKVILLISINIGLYGLYQIAFYIVLLGRGSANAPIIMLVIASINLFFNFLLVPKYGLFGAAISGTLSSTTLVGIAFFMSQKILKWKFPLAESIYIFFRAFIMGLLIWLAMLWSNGSSIYLITVLTLSGIAYGAMDLFSKKNSCVSVVLNRDRVL